MPIRKAEATKPVRASLADARVARAKARLRLGQPIDRRRQIVAAASRLFADRGYEATSVREIADAVNILPGSLYHHFPTKEDIFHEILRPMIAASGEEIDRVHRLPIDPEHMLVTSILTRYYQHLGARDFFQILETDSTLFRSSPELRYVLDHKERMFLLQETVLNAGIAAGLFDPQIDTYLMIINISRIISSSATWIMHGIRHSTDDPEGYTLDRVVDFNLMCILKMVRGSSRLGEAVPRAACELLVAPDLKRMAA